MNPQIAAYFREALARLFAKSPMFFTIYKHFMASLTLAGYAPTVLCDYFNVDLQPHFVKLCTDISKVALGCFMTGFLPAASPAVALKENGELLKQTDEKKMPFTKMCEQRQADKLTDKPVVPETVLIKKEESSDVKGEVQTEPKEDE